MAVAYTTADTTGTAWVQWTGGTASTTCTGDTWVTWCNTGRSYTTAAAATTSTAWTAWVVTSDGRAHPIYARQPAPYAPPKPRELSAEEKAERDRKAREAEETRVGAEVKRKADEEAADTRAEELLVASLDADQKAEYARDKSFHTRDRQGRRYRIRRAWSGHVTRLNDAGKETERFCIHPGVQVPLPDNQLLAKLMIEADEERFFRTANVTRLQPAVS